MDTDQEVNARPFLYQLETRKLECRGSLDGTRQEAYGRTNCDPLQQVEVARPPARRCRKHVKKLSSWSRRTINGAAVRWVEGELGSAAEDVGAGERETKASCGEPEPGEAGAKAHRGGKLLSPERRCAVSHARRARVLSERHAWRNSHAARNATSRHSDTKTDSPGQW